MQRAKGRSGPRRVFRAAGLLAAAAGLATAMALLVFLMFGLVFDPELSESDDATDYAKRITRFGATVDVGRDGTVTITERLTFHHGKGAEGGAYRTIPAEGGITGYGNFDFGLHDVEVLDSDGVQPLAVTREDDGREVKVAIGDDSLRGDHTFTLRYTYDSLLVRGDNGPRLYLDIVGTGWDIPVKSTRATVHFPERPTALDCYAGGRGSSATCDRAETDGSTVEIEHGQTDPGEALSVDADLAGMDDGVAAERTGWEADREGPWDRFWDKLPLFGLLTGLVILCGRFLAGCVRSLTGWQPRPGTGRHAAPPGSGGFAGGGGGGGGAGGGGGGGGGAGGGGGGGGGG